MKTMYIGNLLALSALVCFAKDKTGNAAPAAPADPAPVEPAKTKSIVPTGWKSKGDELSKFIDAQCTGKDGFEMTAFFELCRKNGIAEDKVKHYEDLVAAKAHGIQGRAKMTLRNMLATPARKNGKLIALDGTETPISIAKPAVSGAAAKAQEAATTTGTAAAQ
jgi:hypothetical protein